MPLKHATETALIFLLGAVLLVTGVVVSVLPSPPAGMAWWVLAFVAAAAYPLLLYPLFKSRRADYPFRVLHFAPLFLLGLRFALEFASPFTSWAGVAAGWLRWGWAAPAVAAFFLALGIFCWRVLRQRGMRLRFLLSTLLPFAVFGVLARPVPTGDPTPHGGGTVARTDTGSVIGEGDSSTGGTVIANLDHSADADEERWRVQLRRRERRSERIAEQERRSADMAFSGAVRSAADGVFVSSVFASGAVRTAGTASAGSASSRTIVAVQPPRLPSSGFELGMLGVPLVAGYCATLHERARRRRMA